MIRGFGTTARAESPFQQDDNVIFIGNSLADRMKVVK
ncbi:MAG: hypothetical protein ACI8UO_004876 [Verrucomicrobiales bacterium]